MYGGLLRSMVALYIESDAVRVHPLLRDERKGKDTFTGAVHLVYLEHLLGLIYIHTCIIVYKRIRK